MKTTKLLSAVCLSVGIGMGVNAQIINATQSDLNLWGAPLNTGLAIAPGLDIQAAVYDDGSGNYYINWIESASASIVDSDGNSGDNPDVAYYANADALIVGYEDGGNVFVDDYYLSSLWPTPDYNQGGMTYISSGKDINVDINSQGRGVLTWEDGGKIFACSYQLGGAVGPVVYIDAGVQSDIVLFDDGTLAAITYIKGGPGGDLVIETMDYSNLDAGGHSPINQWVYSPTQIYEFPRIASNRNANFGGSPDNFTVVVQDYNLVPGSATVDAFFVTNGSTMNPQVLVTPDFANCYGDNPLPVVTYHRGRVRIAWSQYYQGGCSGLSQTSPNNPNDVLTKDFNMTGTASATNYLEVNQNQSTFNPYSRNSIASEYDGNYLVTSTNYHGGILFNNQGDLFWKGIFQGNASYIDEHNVITEQENNFSLASSPVDQTIEVISESEDLATFQLLDNAGRVVELKTISNEGNNYSIDISHLSGGTYLLNCSSAAGNEVIRILQVTK